MISTKRDFVKEWQERVKKVDNNYTSSGKTKQENYVVPEGLPVFTVYRRSNTGLNQPKLIGLPKTEADKWCRIFNEKEKLKRTKERDEAYERGLEYKPSIIFLFDVVEQKTDQENVFWNPKQITK